MIPPTTGRARLGPTLLCGALAGLLLWALPGEIGLGSPAALLLAAGCVLTQLARFEFPDRSGITLTLCPVLLLWALEGPRTAAAVAAFAGASAAIVRLEGPARTLLAGARLGTVAALAGMVGSTLGGLQGLPWAWAWFAFGAAYSLADWAIGRAMRACGGGPRTGSDWLVNLVLVPLALLVFEVDRHFGAGYLSLLVVALVAALALVRASVNVHTLYLRVRQLLRERERLLEQLEVESHKLSTVVEGSGDGIFTVDESFHILSANQAFARLVGRDAPWLIGRRCWQVLALHDSQGQSLCHTRCGLRAAMQSGQPSLLEAQFCGLAQAQVPRELATVYTAIRDPRGQLEVGVGVVRDVTTAKEAERAREEFVSMVAHEIRNPLTSIIGNTELLAQSMGDLPESDRRRRLLARIERANEGLLQLVNDLLEVRRAESGRVKAQLGPVWLPGVVRDVVETLARLAEEKGQQLHVTVPELLPPVEADAQLLRQVLTNLVSNAIKYTPEHGTIVVSAVSEITSVTLSVQDDGIGMSPDEQGKLFTKFFRSERQEVRVIRGTGLGLAISRGFVEAMGGTISVTSALGQGSTFSVTLPKAPIDALAACGPEAVTA